MIRTKKTIQTFEVEGIEVLENGWKKQMIKFGDLNRKVKLNPVGAFWRQGILVQKMDYNESIKRIKTIEISHKIGDFRDHSRVGGYADRIQEFKSRFQRIKQNLAASKRKLVPEENSKEVQR